MNNALASMLEKYNCQSIDDYRNALKEIIQEIALLGLWRAKFFEKAAFYGGTALRILYGLNRFSEDLDFSLLKPNNEFSLSPYNTAIQNELAAFGLVSTVNTKTKEKIDSNILTAFIKAGTKIQFISIAVPKELSDRIHHQDQLKIKMEIDINPPGKFQTESKLLLQPIPFSIRSYQLPDLFAGKVHALLCREWLLRIKGRDWYDFVWYIARGVPIKLEHLQERLIQSKHLTETAPFTHEVLKALLLKRIQEIDFEKAKLDVLPFLKDEAAVSMWSTAFFTEVLAKINSI